MIVATLTGGPAQTNCYLVAADGSTDAVVIDPGWEAAAVLARARSRDLTIKLILITHGHFDHIGAVTDLREATGAPMALHPLEADWLAVNGGADLFGLKIRSVAAPDIELTHGQIVEAGALKFETRLAPGHTRGHVVFIEHAQQAAFVGDVLFAGSIGRTDLPGGDYDTLIASIRDQLLALPDEFKVYAGHGPPTTIGAERQFNPFL
ncbi:MAG TPA: MBL fold metallo-hydrolase [Anaerolineae bacterium]|nr:MBL fold metallo-hydrolase [Anaerolineae bacterium]